MLMTKVFSAVGLVIKLALLAVVVTGVIVIKKAISDPKAAAVGLLKTAKDVVCSWVYSAEN